MRVWRWLLLAAVAALGLAHDACAAAKQVHMSTAIATRANKADSMILRLRGGATALKVGASGTSGLNQRDPEPALENCDGPQTESSTTSVLPLDKRTSWQHVATAAGLGLGSRSFGFIIGSRKPVPYTGRRRIILSSTRIDKLIGADPCRVSQRLLRSVDTSAVPQTDNWKWKFYMIRNSDRVNAYAFPGGKIWRATTRVSEYEDLSSQYTDAVLLLQHNDTS
ncbi:hypothetical protein JKP88DRAFT_246320 [Tribonema minus]|uniref:Uncharacterized protein n=1 Tax=Tribonema minus TaxID=303371 RepID=A0A836CCY6_9STRA|nr:hypothetical protein JKP88DRAFT_246320 [Tribonema minus]